MDKHSTADVVSEALKNSNMEPIINKAGRAVGKPVKRYSWDANASNDYKKRPDAAIAPETLRRFSVTHEISRICINTRKRQVAQLDWDIVPRNLKRGQAHDYSKQVELVKQYFKHIAGPRTRFRSLQDVMIEDLLVLDAITLYKRRDAAGRMLYLTPVDAATIKIVVDQYGDTPEPPDPAYRQYINGQLKAEFTINDLIYEIMNPRTTTPYGLAPLESLILVVSSALRAELFNLDYLSFENIPEGLLEMPEGWKTGMISEFQSAWDALLSGNGQESSKLRVVPSGTKYAPTKKPDEMAFKEFNDWLMQITCAMFDVQPHEIGFTDNTNRATAYEQTGVMTRRALLPLTQMLKEVWDDIIGDELGFPELEFKYLGLEDRDSLNDAKTDQVELEAGIMSIDEKRVERGLDPIGIDRPYIKTNREVVWLTSGIMDQDPENESMAPGDTPDNTESGGQGDGGKKPTSNDGVDSRANSQSGDYSPATDQQNGNNSVQTSDKPTFTKGQLIDDELKKFRVFAKNRLKVGKSYRDFASDALDPSLVAYLNVEAAKATTAQQLNKTIHTVSHLTQTLQKDENKQQQLAGTNKTLKVLYGVGGYQAFRKAFKKAIGDQISSVAVSLAALDELPKDVQKFVADNLPALGVEKDQVVKWFNHVVNSAVNTLYQEINVNKSFDLTSHAYQKQLEEDATFLLDKSSLDNTTKKTVANYIVKGREAGQSPQEIAKTITDNIPHITDVRADMIAQSETANIAARAQYDAFKRMGVQEKEWICYGPDPCQICLDNQGADFIPIDAMFPSGDLYPQAHVRCECGWDTERLDISEAMADGAWDGGDFTD